MSIFWEIRSATINENPEFSSEVGAIALYNALYGDDLDKEALILLATQNSSCQRLEMTTACTVVYDKCPSKDVKSYCSEKFGQVLEGLLTAPFVYESQLVYDSMGGVFSNDESVLIEVIIPKYNSEIEELKLAYVALYGKELVDEIDDRLSGDFRNFMQAILLASREEGVSDEESAAEDSLLLVAAVDQQNIDEFIRVLSLRSRDQIAIISRNFNETFGDTLENAVDVVASGDCKKAMIAMIHCSENSDTYFAQVIKDSLTGLLSNNDKKLIRTFVNRSEIDLKDIADTYEIAFGTSLTEDLADRLGSGSYLNTMLAILHADG